MSYLDEKVESLYTIGVILNKIDITLEKINKQFKEVLEKDPNFTGNINVSLCLGGLTGIDKREKIKIK